MKQSEESSIESEYAKGIVLSYVALATAKIRTETITAEDVIKELDLYINTFVEPYPGNPALIVMKLVRDTLSALYSPNKSADIHPFAWLSDLTGHA